MIRSKFALLGLCAMVFGVMAFAATAAHAEVGAQWLLAKLITPTTLELIPFLPAAVELEKDTTGILHSHIAGVAVLFECEKLSAVNAKLLANGSVGESAGNVKGSKVVFKECITKLNGATSGPCQPNAGGTHPGVIETVTGHGLIELHETATGKKVEFVHILPDAGETFATIEMSEECSIGEKVPVIGKAYLEDCEGKFLEHLLKHLTQVATELTELWTISKTAEHVATILGSAWAFLGGEHEGLHFSGDPA